MVEQLHYATTPKYNFPQPIEDLELPEVFVELSLKSMKNMRGSLFELKEPAVNEQDKENLGAEALFIPHSKHFTINPISLTPIHNDAPIIANDVSSIKVGETETGIIYAVRGAIVRKEKKRYTCLRLGPFPFHVTEENKKELYNLLRRQYLNAKDESNTPNLFQMQSRICSLLERWIQMGITRSSQESIILWDGSLTAGTADSPIGVLSQLLETARKHLNTVLAFSKETNLRLLGCRLADLLWKSQPPCLLKIDDVAEKLGPFCLLGNVYAVKLTEGNCSFRLDIDRRLSCEAGIDALQKLLGNELIFQSYPETLRLAHIYSTFTANEVIGIQRFISKQCGLKIVVRPNVRRILFGRFGKGPEG